MWKWNVYGRSFEDQVIATAASRSDKLVMQYTSYREELSRGRTARDLIDIAAESAVILDFLDGLTCWSPVRFPPDPGSFVHMAFQAAHDFSPAEAFEACAELGLQSILAMAGFEIPSIPLSAMIDHFGEFCEHAARFGIWVDLEPLPMMGVATLQQAWAIVEGAKCENSGILLDTWHFMRGGADFDLLRRIPRGRIANIQVGDAIPKLPSHSLWEDAMHSRVLPGEGELPLAKIVGTLFATQDIRSIGLELMSAKIGQLSAVEAGRRIGDILDQVISDASHVEEQLNSVRD
jgi:hypothetical protein